LSTPEPDPSRSKEPKKQAGINLEGQKKKKSLHRSAGVRQYYDSYANRYDADYAKPFWKLYDDITWHFTEPYLPAEISATILDIGGGTAKWAVKVAQLGYYVICGDISEGMLAVAREKVEALQLQELIEVKTLDIRDLSEYADNSFPLVLALGDVISYAIDDDLAVGELFRVCEPGGYCVASVDNKLTYIVNEVNYDHLERIEPLLENGISHFFKLHSLKAYFPRELDALFTRHGFVTQKVIGKPVLANVITKKRRDEKLIPNYDLFLRLELQLAADPAFAGHGGHLQIIARKPPPN